MLGSEAVAVTFAGKAFGMFAWTIPRERHKHETGLLTLFFLLCTNLFCLLPLPQHRSFRCHVDIWRGEWNFAHIVAPLLCRRLRGPNARNPHDDPDPAADADTRRSRHLAAIDGLSLRVGHLCAD